MRIYASSTFSDLPKMIIRDFVNVSEEVDVGEWQSTSIKGDRSKVTWELREASLYFGMMQSKGEAQQFISPNLPWAEDHFLERVGGVPLNPPPSQAWWPFAQEGNEAFMRNGGKFSHTYPERFWPKFASVGETRPNGRQVFVPHNGIRFSYGDLNDVANRLIRNPLTRQAFLPVYFPEDNGAPDGERVPCTLGYLFLVRNNQLHLTYYIRSCDFMRHFRDDVYMGMRLAHWMGAQILEGTGLDLDMGDMAMHIGSFHVFEGDLPMLKYLHDQNVKEK
jgi:hypothetical protein